MDTIIENAYRNPAYGLRSEPSLYKYLKPKYPEITHAKIKAWLNNQVIKDIGTKVISYKRGAAPKAKYIL